MSDARLRASLCLLLVLALVGCSSSDSGNGDSDADKAKPKGTKTAKSSKSKTSPRKKTSRGSKLTFEKVSSLMRRIAMEKDELEAEELLDKLDDMRPDCMPHLLTIAKDTDHVASLQALGYLGWEQPEDRLGPYQAFIRETLSDKDPKRRGEALFVLYSTQWPDATDDRLLTILSKDTSDHVRGCALECIALRPKLTSALWKKLLWGLKSKKEDISTSACAALGEVGDKIQPFHQELLSLYRTTKNNELRYWIIVALGNCKLDQKVGPLLRSIAAERPSPKTLAALKAMLALPPETPGLAQVAKKWLDQLDFLDLRMAALKVLAHARPITPQQLENLFSAASKHQCQMTRNRALEALTSIGPEAAAIADKVAGMYATSPRDKDKIAWAVNCIKPDHPLVLEHLEKALAKGGDLGFYESQILESSDSQRFAAVFDAFATVIEAKVRESKGPNGFFLDKLSDYRQLGDLDAKQKSRVATLMAEVLEKTDDTSCCGNACKVLQRLGEPAVVALPGLRKALRDKDLQFKGYHALHAVAKIGPKAAAALPEVRKLSARKGWKSLAAAVMIRLSPAETEQGLDILRKQLQVGDGNGKIRALMAAACLGKAAAPLRDTISPLADDAEDDLGVFARIALATSGDPKPIVRQFIADLQDKDMKRRSTACEALVLLQKYAGDAVPVLKEMMAKDRELAAFYAGTIYQISGQRVSGMLWGFNNIPGGYPW